MTSANMTYYAVTNKANGQTVEESQHCLCRDRIKPWLAQFTPPENFEIEVNSPDENEADNIVYEGNLKAYLNRNSEEPLCHVCAKPLCTDIKEVTFATGGSPLLTFTVKIKAVWCRNPTCCFQTNEEAPDYTELPHAVTTQSGGSLLPPPVTPPAS